MVFKETPFNPFAAEILNIEWPENGFDILRFKGLNADGLQRLIDEGYVDPDCPQNDSLTPQEFLSFMKEHLWVKAHGYAVTPDRDDSRVSVEGLEGKSPNKKESQAFQEFCGQADELDIPVSKGSCRSWWD